MAKVRGNIKEEVLFRFDSEDLRGVYTERSEVLRESQRRVVTELDEIRRTPLRS
jgi:hypothetical protein